MPTMKFYVTFHILLILQFASAKLEDVMTPMRCLVSRPGYGLVSEECPLGTVSCRIRIEDDSTIGFYAYSPLYDRNQFVCVMRNEYSGDDKRSGCMRKKYGGIRCWCSDQANCNTVETGKRLYERFLVVDQSHENSENISVEEPLSFGHISSMITPSTSVKFSKVTPSWIIGNTEKQTTTTQTSQGQGAAQSSKDHKNVGKSVEELANFASSKSNLLFAHKIPSASTPSTTSATTIAVNVIPEERPPKKHRQHKHRKHFPGSNRNETNPTSRKESRHRKNQNLSGSKAKSSDENRVASQSMRSEFDADQGVHVIHVGAREQYDQLIASPEFAGILSHYANGNGRIETPKLRSAPLKNSAPSWDDDLERLADFNEGVHSNEQLSILNSKKRQLAAEELELDKAANNRYYYSGRSGDNRQQEDMSLDMRPLSHSEMAKNVQQIAQRSRIYRNDKNSGGGRNVDGPRGRGTPSSRPSDTSTSLEEFFDDAFFSAAHPNAPKSTALIAFIGTIVLLTARYY